MNIRQPPWYQDKKTHAELYNNQKSQPDTTPTLVPRGRGKKQKTKKIH